MRSVFCLLAPALLSACAHSPYPLSQERLPVDPAVAFLNDRVDGRPFREAYDGSGEDSIHYVEGGTGPTVVFIHGFPSFWYSWADQLEEFHQCRRVVAIDAPGANLSAKPEAEEAYRVEALADRLDRLIDRLAPGEKIVLVGHDWGGALAWSYAKAHPDKLDRLAVFSAPPYDLFLQLLAQDADQQLASAYMQRLVALDRGAIVAGNVPEMLYRMGYAHMVERGKLTPEEGSLFRAALSDPVAIDSGIAWYRANIPTGAFDPEDYRWPSERIAVSVPTLLVTGSEDGTFPNLLANARGHAEQLTVETFSNVGHWTPFEDPEVANRALGNFLGLNNGKCGTQDRD